MYPSTKTPMLSQILAVMPSRVDISLCASSIDKLHGFDALEGRAGGDVTYGARVGRDELNHLALRGLLRGWNHRARERLQVPVTLHCSHRPSVHDLGEHRACRRARVEIDGDHRRAVSPNRRLLQKE